MEILLSPRTLIITRRGPYSLIVAERRESMKAATREIADQDAVPFDGKVKAVLLRPVFFYR